MIHDHILLVMFNTHKYSPTLQCGLYFKILCSCTIYSQN